MWGEGVNLRLPNGDNAQVAEEKLRGYLLSEAHPVGRAKAKLLNAVGFDATNVAALERGLIEIARDHNVTEVIPFIHGTKYVIKGTLRGPDGTHLEMITVWIIETGADTPRFVTAYPS